MSISKRYIQVDSARTFNQNRILLGRYNNQRNSEWKDEIVYSKSKQSSSNQQGWDEQSLLKSLQPQTPMNQFKDGDKDLLIDPAILVWMEFQKIMKNISEKYGVQIQYKQYCINFKGEPQNVSDAKDEISYLVQNQFMQEYLEKNNVEDFRTNNPYIELLINEDYIELKQKYKPICVMARGKLKLLLLELEAKGFARADDILSRMPKSFVILFCQKQYYHTVKSQILDLVDVIKFRINNDITPILADEFDTRGADFKARDHYHLIKHDWIYKMYQINYSFHIISDLVWLYQRVDLKKLSRQASIYLEFEDHVNQFEKLNMRIYGKKDSDVSGFLEFIYNNYLSVTGITTVQYYSPQPVTQSQINHLKEQLTDFVYTDELRIIRSDAILSTAMLLDSLFQRTTIVQEVTRQISNNKQNGQCLFLLGDMNKLQQLKQKTIELIALQERKSRITPQPENKNERVDKEQVRSNEKDKFRDRERDAVRERAKTRERDLAERLKEKEKQREKEKEIQRDKEREKEREREREKERERLKILREREQEKEREKEMEREKEKEKDCFKMKERDRERDANRERDQRQKEIRFQQQQQSQTLQNQVNISKPQLHVHQNIYISQIQPNNPQFKESIIVNSQKRIPRVVPAVQQFEGSQFNLTPQVDEPQRVSYKRCIRRLQKQDSIQEITFFNSSADFLVDNFQFQQKDFDNYLIKHYSQPYTLKSSYNGRQLSFLIEYDDEDLHNLHEIEKLLNDYVNHQLLIFVEENVYQFFQNPANEPQCMEIESKLGCNIRQCKGILNEKTFSNQKFYTPVDREFKGILDRMNAQAKDKQPNGRMYYCVHVHNLGHHLKSLAINLVHQLIQKSSGYSYIGLNQQ